MQIRWCSQLPAAKIRAGLPIGSVGGIDGSSTDCVDDRRDTERPVLPPSAGSQRSSVGFSEAVDARRGSTATVVVAVVAVAV